DFKPWSDMRGSFAFLDFRGERIAFQLYQRDAKETLRAERRAEKILTSSGKRDTDTSMKIPALEKR
ncbi:MAG: hypothetical protein JW843_06910, partial [Candidatus Aminicenantes bacterium]|nr:hypothetical protein [Candidatus Aminicenantes bacterium]